MFDVVGSPLGGVDAAAIVVQGFAVVVGDVLRLELGSAAAVEVLFVETVRRLKFRGLVASCNGASVGRMHRDSILGIVVDSLEDILSSQLCQQPDRSPSKRHHLPISPNVGHGSGPRSQYAGQVPQPVGMCLTSAMNKPCEYALLLINRTEGRPRPPRGNLLVVSTLNLAAPFVVVTYPFLSAVVLSTYWTCPLVGSPPVKKLNWSKKP